MKGKINKMKQLLSFLFKGTEELAKKRQIVLTSAPSSLESFLDFALPLLKEEWIKQWI